MSFPIPFPQPFQPDAAAPLPFVFVPGMAAGPQAAPEAPRGLLPMRQAIWQLSGMGLAGLYSVLRSTGGALVNGRWVETPNQTFFIRASIQPIRGADLLRLPQGERIESYVTIYSDTPLQTADQPNGKTADVVTWNGRTYEVQTVFDWETNGGFVKAIAKRQGR